MKKKSLQLPPIKLDYMKAITDETGIFQHAKFSTPNRKEGYSIDDNARALIVCAKYNQLNKNSKITKLANTYLSFLHHMQTKNGQLHNFLGYDRRFLDKVGSDDSLGRTLWALGHVINSNLNKEKKLLAKEIFKKALSHAIKSTSPRTKAFTILGLGQYQSADPSKNTLSEKINELSKQLLNLYNKTASANWSWFESYITYCNAKLPQALFEAYKHTKNKTYLQVAKDSFNFTLKVQMNNNVFTPIGNNGWYKKGEPKAMYDQQSVEAYCMTKTALTAFEITKNTRYKTAAKTSFQWYHGKNIQDLKVYDPKTGSCYDGITPKGLNLNQGAESTITYLLARLNIETILK